MPGPTNLYRLQSAHSVSGPWVQWGKSFTIPYDDGKNFVLIATTNLADVTPPVFFRWTYTGGTN